MTYTDIETNGFISRLPEKWQPFAVLLRLDRPIGWWLLLLPGWWGIVLGANGIIGSDWQFNMYSSDLRLMFLFFIGAIVMRGAGCIINDLWDRDLDGQVERTKNRPIAAGQVSVFHAIVLAFFLFFCGFIILLQTSMITIGLGLLCIPLIIAYPLMKRFTWWPQAFLGITFNMGALMGWSAAVHELRLEAVILYVAGICWTMGYDTIYACQDREDDALVGIKSTARLFANNAPFWIGLFYLLTIGLLCLTLFIAEAGILSYILMIFPAFHLLKQIKELDIFDHSHCLHQFKSNRNFGLWVLLPFAFVDFKIVELHPEFFAHLQTMLQNMLPIG